MLLIPKDYSCLWHSWCTCPYVTFTAFFLIPHLQQAGRSFITELCVDPESLLLHVQMAYGSTTFKEDQVDDQGRIDEQSIKT